VTCIVKFLLKTFLVLWVELVVNDVNPRVLITTSGISEKSDGWARNDYIIFKFTYFSSSRSFGAFQLKRK